MFAHKILMNKPATIEEFIQLRDKLLSIGYNTNETNLLRSFQNFSKISNNLNGNEGHFGLLDPLGHRERIDLGEFNADLFLAVAAMQTEGDIKRFEAIVRIREDRPIVPINSIVFVTEAPTQTTLSIEKNGLRIGAANGWHAQYFRRATVAEIIAHFRPAPVVEVAAVAEEEQPAQQEEPAFVLPEMWKLQRDNLNHQEINAWCNANRMSVHDTGTYFAPYGPICSHSRQPLHSACRLMPHAGCVEITYQQWRDHVLNAHVAEAVEPVEPAPYIFPENWAVHATAENRREIFAWCDRNPLPYDNSRYSQTNLISGYIHANLVDNNTRVNYRRMLPQGRLADNYQSVTFEQWREHILRQEPVPAPAPFVYPERWYVARNHENFDQLNEKMLALNRGQFFGSSGYFYSHPIRDNLHYCGDLLPGYIQISTQQFLDYQPDVVNEVVAPQATEFVLPARWVVARNTNNYHVINAWCNTHRLSTDDNGHYHLYGGFIHSHDVQNINTATCRRNRSSRHADYTQITFEQFQQYVMNVPAQQREVVAEERILIGYKSPFNLFTGLNHTVSAGDVFILNNDGTYATAQKWGANYNVYAIPAEIVKTWEPVYEEATKRVTTQGGEIFTIENGIAKDSQQRSYAIAALESLLDLFNASYVDGLPHDVEAAPTSVKIGRVLFLEADLKNIVRAAQ